jgi:hypothetical protein
MYAQRIAKEFNYHNLTILEKLTFTIMYAQRIADLRTKRKR